MFPGFHHNHKSTFRYAKFSVNIYVLIKKRRSLSNTIQHLVVCENIHYIVRLGGRVVVLVVASNLTSECVFIKLKIWRSNLGSSCDFNANLYNETEHD